MCLDRKDCWLLHYCSGCQKSISDWCWPFRFTSLLGGRSQVRSNDASPANKGYAVKDGWDYRNSLKGGTFQYSNRDAMYVGLTFGAFDATPNT